MLASKYTTTYGRTKIVQSSGAASFVDAIASNVDFVVSPSPCLNRGDRKHPNPYRFSKIATVEPFGAYRTRNIYGQETSYSGCLGSYFGAIPTIFCEDQMNTANNRALSKLYSKLKNSELSLNTTIGEGRETLLLLGAVYGSAKAFYDDLSKASKKATRGMVIGIRNPLQTVGGLVLLWNLALKPLLADVEAIRNHALSEKVSGMSFAVKGRASCTSSKQRQYIASGATKVEDRTLTQRVEYGVTAHISDLHRFENWRAGLTVRPTLLWELTTLSFVVDYFVNIGEYLELLEASILNNGFTLEHGFKTVSTLDSFEMTSKRDIGPSQLYVSDSGHHWLAYRRETTKDRSVLTSLPFPVRPTVKLPSASTQLLNCAALLSQLIEKR